MSKYFKEEGQEKQKLKLSEYLKENEGVSFSKTIEDVSNNESFNFNRHVSGINLWRI